MIIACAEIGEIEVMDDMTVYGEDLTGEEQSVIVQGEDLKSHQIETIERLMADIRKPAVALRDYIISLRV